MNKRSKVGVKGIQGTVLTDWPDPWWSTGRQRQNKHPDWLAPCELACPRHQPAQPLPLLALGSVTSWLLVCPSPLKDSMSTDIWLFSEAKSHTTVHRKRGTAWVN